MLLSYYCLRHFVELWALTNWELIPEKEKQPIIVKEYVHIDQVWVLCKAITLETFKMWSLKAIITTIHPCQTCVCMRAFAISRPENYKMKNGNRSARNCTNYKCCSKIRNKKNWGKLHWLMQWTLLLRNKRFMLDEMT